MNLIWLGEQTERCFHISKDLYDVLKPQKTQDIFESDAKRTRAAIAREQNLLQAELIN